jgi:hypothetical protein
MPFILAGRRDQTQGFDAVLGLIQIEQLGIGQTIDRVTPRKTQNALAVVKTCQGEPPGIYRISFDLSIGPARSVAQDSAAGDNMRKRGSRISADQLPKGVQARAALLSSWRPVSS